MPITTEGLLAYWHYQSVDESSRVWNNITPYSSAPDGYDISYIGATLRDNGLYFDGVDDVTNSFSFPNVVNSSFTIEVRHEFTEIISYPFQNEKGGFTHRFGYNTSPNSYGIFSTHFGGNGGSIIAGTLPSEQGLYTVTYVYDHNAQTSSIYLEGELLARRPNYGANLNTNLVIGRGQYMCRGLVTFVRVYNRPLNEEEIANNATFLNEQGLESGVEPAAAPEVNYVNATSNTISNNADKDRSLVTFSFNQDVVQWVVKVLGASHDTGYTADSGGEVPKDTEITAEVDSTELQQEGQNKVNIYGQNSNGDWTPYSN